MVNGGRMGHVARVGLLAVVLLLASCSSSDGGGGSEGGGVGGDSTTTAAPGAAASGEIAALAYNVAGLPQEISSETPGKDIPLISPKLEAFDLVLTQEDFDWWGELAEQSDFVNYHERLRADTTFEHMSPRHPGPDAVDLGAGDRMPPEVGDGLGVMSRFPLDGDDRVPWLGCFGGFDTSDGGAGDCLAMKGFQRTTIELADGVQVDVYNLHAEAGGTDEDQRLQEENFAQLADFIAENSDGRAIILGGDTNLHTGGDHADGRGGADTVIWDRFLEATGLTDACAATDCPVPQRIDKFAFRSGGGVTLEALSHDFLGDDFSDDAGEALSDHEPLLVRFAWSA